MQINEILAFLQENALTEIDFLFPSNESAIKESLLPAHLCNRFTAIAKNGAGCLLCVWNPDKDHKLATDNNNLPIVWLDSEGFPKSVFAANLNEALSLFPFGSGFIYDVLCAWQRHLEDSKNYKRPSRRFTKKAVKIHLKTTNELPEVQQLLQFNTQHGIKTSSDPVALIGNAIQSLPNLEEWLK